MEQNGLVPPRAPGQDRDLERWKSIHTSPSAIARHLSPVTRRHGHSADQNTMLMITITITKMGRGDWCEISSPGLVGGGGAHTHTYHIHTYTPPDTRASYSSTSCAYADPQQKMRHALLLLLRRLLLLG